MSGSPGTLHFTRTSDTGQVPPRAESCSPGRCGREGWSRVLTRLPALRPHGGGSAPGPPWRDSRGPPRSVRSRPAHPSPPVPPEQTPWARLHVQEQITRSTLLLVASGLGPCRAGQGPCRPGGRASQAGCPLAPARPTACFSGPFVAIWYISLLYVWVEKMTLEEYLGYTRGRPSSGWEPDSGAPLPRCRRRGRPCPTAPLWPGGRSFREAEVALAPRSWASARIKRAEPTPRTGNCV